MARTPAPRQPEAQVERVNGRPPAGPEIVTWHRDSTVAHRVARHRADTTAEPTRVVRCTRPHASGDFGVAVGAGPLPRGYEEVPAPDGTAPTMLARSWLAVTTGSMSPEEMAAHIASGRSLVRALVAEVEHVEAALANETGRSARAADALAAAVDTLVDCVDPAALGRVVAPYEMQAWRAVIADEPRAAGPAAELPTAQARGLAALDRMAEHSPAAEPLSASSIGG